MEATSNYYRTLGLYGGGGDGNIASTSAKWFGPSPLATSRSFSPALAYRAATALPLWRDTRTWKLRDCEGSALVVEISAYAPVIRDLPLWWKLRENLHAWAAPLAASTNCAIAYDSLFPGTLWLLAIALCLIIFAVSSTFWCHSGCSILKSRPVWLLGCKFLFFLCCFHAFQRSEIEGPVWFGASSAWILERKSPFPKERRIW